MSRTSWSFTSIVGFNRRCLYESAEVKSHSVFDTHTELWFGIVTVYRKQCHHNKVHKILSQIGIKYPRETESEMVLNSVILFMTVDKPSLSSIYVFHLIQKKNNIRLHWPITPFGKKFEKGLQYVDKLQNWNLHYT